jgi:hypothetical protein
MVFFTLGVITASPPTNLFFLLFTLPFWGVGLFQIYKILFSLYGTMRLIIDEKQIVLIKKMFKFTWHSTRPASRQAIDRIVYVSRHHRKNANDDRIIVPAQLTIWAGNHQYKLNNGTTKIRDTELEWLAYELGKWLRLPISRE